ncbi:ATP-binding cassette domain-containing protein [Chelativorans salis]|uniref:ATP-binding cassette domain-containing protein n=1 Tax=Chelativorans salis TaxID=2978478 RepID=A0ABT2LJA8_9HYPH|nr:ATP-binding cassette domain-containing protein [Chelativorans sp. EGI FJ00035]MCT7374676.1 ATP-binding cassette domain-containing protein [Chelativorans sp. EGI FJ00035]
MDETRILFEPYEPSEGPTAGAIGKYIFHPIRSLMRQALLFQLMLSLASSLLFITNFNVLAFAVPSQSIGAFWAASWLIAGVAVTVFLTQLLVQRAQLYLDSLAQEREEILRLSLMWSLRPQFVAAHGPVAAHQLCAVLARSGKAAAEALLFAAGSLSILPMLVLMYIRLPTFLFVVTIAIAILGALPQVVLQLQRHRQHRGLETARAAASGILCRITTNIARLKFITMSAAADGPEEAMASLQPSRLELPASDAVIEACTVDFGFNGVDANLFKNFSLRIAAGHLVAICGASGSGKTTLLELLSGQRQPIDGAVYYKGKRLMGPAPAGFVFADDEFVEARLQASSPAKKRWTGNAWSGHSTAPSYRDGSASSWIPMAASA